MATDLQSLLAQFNVSPSAEERKKAADMALMRMGLGILSANQPSRLPTNPLGILAQGGMQGLDQYQTTLKDEVGTRRANAQTALQGLQIQKEIEKAAALKNLFAPQGTPPLQQQPAGVPSAAGVVDPAKPVAATDLPAPAAQGGFQPIPVDRLAAAAASGVDIKPFLALNAEARPDLAFVDAGNEIIVRDKKSMRVLERIKKGAAPGSIPFPVSDMTPAQAREHEIAARRAGAASIHVGTKETDKKFAADHVDFATGGYADLQKQLEQLQQVSDALGQSKGGTLTGPVVGMLPDSLRALAFPKSQAAKDAVEEVVQRNLRLILGAQFTAQEGERLIARAYNPMLGEPENKKRIDRLIDQIREAAEAKLSASRYFMANGTLEGWKGKTWTMKDFDVDGVKTVPQVDDETRRLLDKYAPQN